MEEKAAAVSVIEEQSDNPAYWMQVTIMHTYDLLRHYYLNNNTEASVSRIRLLSFLKDSGPTSLKELSAKLMLSASSLCITLNKLVAVKLVDREPDLADRRNTYYRINETGLNYLKASTAEMIDCFEKAIADLSPNDKKMLIQSLSSTYEILSRI